MKITFELDLSCPHDQRFAENLLSIKTALSMMPTPPESFQSHGPSDEPTAVHVWAPEGKEEQAAAIAELAENCEIVPESTDVAPTPRPPKTKAKPAKKAKTKPAPEPEAKPAPKPEPVDNTPDAKKKNITPDGKRVRELLLEAGGPNGERIEEGKNIIRKIGNVKELKDLPKEKAPEVITALEAFIAENEVKA